MRQDASAKNESQAMYKPAASAECKPAKAQGECSAEQGRYERAIERSIARSKLHKQELQAEVIAARLEHCATSFDELMAKVEAQMQEDAEDAVLLYQGVMHKFICSDPNFNAPSTGLNGFLIDVDEELEYKELTFVGHVMKAVLNGLRVHYEDPHYYGYFTPFLKSDEAVSVELLQRIMSDLDRGPFIKSGQNTVELSCYYLYLNTDKVAADAQLLLAKLKSRNVTVYTRSDMLTMAAERKFFY